VYEEMRQEEYKMLRSCDHDELDLWEFNNDRCDRIDKYNSPDFNLTPS